MSVNECHIGFFYFNFRIPNNEIINEIEIGISDEFKLEYYHAWYRTQVHCLTLGNIYLYWRGIPILDQKS